MGDKQPNAWGLYDIAGNVREWCQNWMHGDYEGTPVDGSAWLDGAGIYRVSLLSKII